jgi:acetyl esterase/lipase
MHGGGFKFGSKKAKGIRIWSSDFARRGYVCAAVNYRLSKKNPLKNFNALVQGCFDAVQDISIAIEFMKRNATQYRIDTTRIILAGNSAGAIIALHAAYTDNSQLASLINNADSAIHTESRNRSNISAVVNFWGALFDSSWLRNAKVPIVSVHGRKDRIVPYIQSESLFGSFLIHQKADSLKIPNRLKTYDRYGHELQKHFIPILRSRATKRRWREAGQFAADFILAEVIN